MAVASCGRRSRPGSRPCSSSTAGPGSLSPDEYARFVLPATRAVLDGIADLGVPTILFGVGTGELLGLMATAGADVVGVDWRVPLDEARTPRRGGPCACRATSTRPCVSPPGPSSRRRPGPGAGRRGRRRERHRPRLQSRPRRPARSRHRHPGRGRRPGARRERAGMNRVCGDGSVGVLVMAHGTPRTNCRDRALLHPDPPRPTARHPSSWPSWSGRYAAIGGVSPLTERTQAQVDALRAALERRGRRAATWWPSGPSTPIP